MFKRNPGWIYLLIVGAESFIGTLIFTVLAIYYVTVVKMNPLQLVLVGTVLELAILLFEVPTGVVADTFSRRLSVIIGMFVLGTAFLLEGSLPLVAGVFLAEAIRGIGHTFISGALDAWIAGEVGEEAVGPIYLRAGQISRAAGLVAVGVSVGLGSIWVQLPVLLGGALYLLLGVALVFMMPERGFEPAAGTEAGVRSPFRQMAGTLREGTRVVRGRPMLQTVLLSSLFVGLALEGWDRLWEARFLLTLQFPAFMGWSAVVWFGIISVLGQLLGIAAMELFRRRVNTDNVERTTRVLLTLQAVEIAIMLAFALAPSFGAAFVLILLFQVFGGLIGPVAGTWSVQHTEPRTRATVLSMGGLLNAGGQTIGGPAVGAIGAYGSIRAALITSALLLSPLLVLYNRVLRRERRGAPLVVDVPVEG